MQCKLCLAASAGILITVVGLSLPAVGQPEKKPVTAPSGSKPAAPAAPAGQPSDEEMMKMMQEAAAVGEQHKQMAIIAGEWDAVVKFWNPADPSHAEESKGTATNKLILDGRYIDGDYTGTMMGAPFQGKMLWAFNKLSGKYESTWIDNFGTGISFSEDGVYDPAKKAYTSTITMWDPMTGTKSSSKEVVTIVDNNKHVMEMFGPGMDGKEMRMMEITYTRKSAGAKPATR